MILSGPQGANFNPMTGGPRSVIGPCRITPASISFERGSTNSCWNYPKLPVSTPPQRKTFDTAMSHELRANPPITFAEAAAPYRGERRFLAPWVEYFGDTPLDEITQEVIDRAIADRFPNAAPSTRVRQGVNPIAGVLHDAAARGLCEYRQIRRPKQPKLERLRWLWPAEASCLIGACSDHLKPIVLLCLTTTCHPIEAIFLDWHQVDLIRRRVKFPRGPKRNARTVSLHPAIVATLARLSHCEGAVFRCPDGRPYRTERGAAAVKTAFAAACRRAKNQRFHYQRPAGHVGGLATRS